MKAATLALLVIAAASAPAQSTAQNLAVTRPIASQSEDGSPISGSEALVPGETVFFSFEVTGHKTGTSGKVQLTGHIQAFDPAGLPISLSDEQVIATTLSQEDKQWKPKLRSQFQVPSVAPPGTYRIKFDVTDLQSNKTVTGEAAFQVRGRTVARSDELTIRNLHFYRTQEDERPLGEAVYQAGDMMWVKLDIVGYRYGEQNAVDVAYDVEVVDPKGKTLFMQTDAAVERSQSFYPLPWVSGEFNLSLQTNMTPGLYTMNITAHDGTGKQTATAKGEFRVQ